MNKHLISLLTGVLVLIAPAMAQIPNGGFEDWSNAGGYDDPDHWITFNWITWPLGAVLSCEEGTPGAVGAAFAKVTTLDIPGEGILPGSITTGEWGGGDAIAGFPYALRPAALNGKWQYDVQAGDGASVTVFLSKWNPGTQQQDQIGFGNVIVSPGAMTIWQNFSVSITYFSPLYPDTAMIGVVSGNAAGSTIWVDDLSLGAFVGVNEQVMDPGFELYPSPATDVLRISTGELLAEVAVLEMSGREVSHEAINTDVAVLDVAHLPAGMYIARVRFVDGRSACRRFVRN